MASVSGSNGQDTLNLKVDNELITGLGDYDFLSGIGGVHWPRITPFCPRTRPKTPPMQPDASVKICGKSEMTGPTSRTDEAPKRPVPAAWVSR